MIKKLLLTVILFGFIYTGRASHLVGGELSYRCLGGNNYEVTLKIYRDCINGQAPFDNEAAVFIYDASGAHIQTLLLPFPGSTQVPSTINNPCFTPPANVCVEEAIYQATVNLPALSGGYTLAYQRCCRNYTIVNLTGQNQGADLQGSTYTATIPGGNAACNGNPVFKELPPVFICSGVPLSFDHSAIDPDGDQLVYELCDPFLGASSDCPMPGSTASGNCMLSSPVPQHPGPPFTPVSWVSPYNGTYPMASSPALAINAGTGLLTGTPTQTGQWVVGVCVKEYRNGVLLSTSRRDFQFNVINCPQLVVASVPPQQNFCSGFTVNFGNASVNATTFQWDFGVPNISTDVSSDKYPAFTYPAAGVYTVTLIAEPGSNCADTTTAVFDIKPLLDPDFAQPQTTCLAGSTYNFSAGGSFSTSAVFNWSFQNAVPSASSQQNPANIVFTSAGTHNISLSVSENGCTKTVNKTVTILPDIMASIAPQADFCTGTTVSFSNSSSNASSYYWDFGDGAGYSQSANPTYSYADTGTYAVMLIAEGLCPDTAYAVFEVMPVLTATIAPSMVQCLTGNNFNFSANGTFSATAILLWNFGNASPASSSQLGPQNISFFSADTHAITLTVEEYGCTKQFTDTVTVIEDAIADIQAQQEFCIGYKVNFTNLSQHSTSWLWNFGDAATTDDTSSAFNPYYNYPDSGIYTITLTAANEACTDTDAEIFYVYPLLQPQIITNDSGQCFNGNIFDFTAGGAFGPDAVFLWDFGDHASINTSSDKNVSGISFDSLGGMSVTLTFFENGCVKTDTLEVYLYKHPEALFDSVPKAACVPLTASFTNRSFAETTLYYKWIFGDGAFSEDKDPVHIYDKSGAYDVTLIAYTREGCIDSDTITWQKLVNAYGHPTAGFIPDPAEASIFEPTIRFNVASSEHIARCEYSFGDGTASADCNPLHSYPDTGDYEVVQIVYNEYECPDTISGRVRINPEYRFFLPNTFTPNGDEKNDVFLPVMIGVSEFNMKIFNRWGEKVFESVSREHGWDGRINGNDAQQDVYLYLITVKNVFHQSHSFNGHINLIR